MFNLAARRVGPHALFSPLLGGRVRPYRPVSYSHTLKHERVFGGRVRPYRPCINAVILPQSSFVKHLHTVFRIVFSCPNMWELLWVEWSPSFEFGHPGCRPACLVLSHARVIDGKAGGISPRDMQDLSQGRYGTRVAVALVADHIPRNLKPAMMLFRRLLRGFQILF